MSRETFRRNSRNVSCLISTVLLLAVVLSVSGAAADENPDSADTTEFFQQHVYSVFRRSCIECHGAAKQEGGLRLDSAQALHESGSVIPGEPQNSELVRRISLAPGHDEIMPAVGRPLTAAQVRAIRTWIRNGAVWPKQFVPEQHWAWLPVSRPPLPAASSDTLRHWPRNPIDVFVLKQLVARGLAPSPAAAPETQIRRVYMDLTGLPPDPQTVERLCRDFSDETWEALVDSLLARPQFGEKWARHWLDLARYADSHGFQRDNLRDIWPWRDWVIRAFNADMPFDQFTIEQIAGDLLPNATEEQKIATGFHRCTPTNVEAGSLPEETRIEQVIDRVNTTATVWLGTTLECAQCHDHKYDPFTQRDYYRMLAYFNNTQLEADRANPKSPSSIKFLGPSMEISNPQKDKQRKVLETRLQQVNEQLAARQNELQRDLPEWARHLAEQTTRKSESVRLHVVDLKTSGTNDTYQRLPDHSVLLTSDHAASKDEYHVTLQATVQQAAAIRLDALTHPSLPQNGPGRAPGQRPNFVLTEFSVKVDGKPIPLTRATADFSQKNWDVNGALRNQPRTGWAIAPQFGRDHWALFELQHPLTLSTENVVTVTMKFDYGGVRSIGRFALSAVTGPLHTDKLPADILSIARTPPDQWTAKNRKQLTEHRLNTDPAAQRLNRQITSLKTQIAELAPDTTLVMIELPQPRPARIFVRGDYRTPGEPVTPGTPAALPAPQPGPANRLTLARWLVDKRNPLVARVTVNRFWMEIFGRGLVATPEDFGTKGEPPSHPQLLDWLASEFVDQGWSVKKLLRTIVLSSTYRQSSVVRPEAATLDPHNVWLHRGPRYRMSAEMIRDHLLSAAGLLSLRQYGPPVRPYQPPGVWNKVGGTAYKYEVSPGEDRYRRGVYVIVKRGAPYPSFVNFDATARLVCKVQRSRTNTPLQALTLLNDPVYVEAAQAMADRILRQSQLTTTDQRLDYAFALCTSRRPTAAERTVLKNLLEEELSLHRQSARLPAADEDRSAATENAAPADSDSAGQLRAWTAVTTALINLHETITQH